ncbi:vomeronasal type-2 receptor 1-like [Colossoma macropomum]|uniref:vomeronasal type-2 receptor 1-like n=1 Tax=Colossoma macropomum TaxID=42526 RepID=UPI0018649E23|nr:vomeronasal type-2 receptor 1-like [Colossoma macropomum]
MYQDGDLILGGLFEVHFLTVFPELSFTSEPEQPYCEQFDMASFQQAQTMAFAIDEINRNPKLLPNITLGYHMYDNCVKLAVAFRAAMALLSGTDEAASSVDCTGSPPVIGIVGDPGSTHSIAISSVLGLFRVPMVSYFATCSCLSDRRQYPSFFRTIPSDAFQVYAIVQILKRFGWTWVGLVYSDDDYGIHAAHAFHQDVQGQLSGCVAYSEMLPRDNNRKDVGRIVEAIKASTARVVVVISTEAYLLPLMDEVALRNVTGRQWIASEAWATSPVFLTPRLLPYLGGTLGIAIRRGEIQGLRDFLLRLQPDRHPKNNMVRNFWEEMFGCTFDSGGIQADGEGEKKVCTGEENLRNTDTAYTDISELRASYNVYKAVYALAHALHDLTTCEDGKGPFSGHICASLGNIQPWQVVDYLQKVNFTTGFGDHVSFDKDGNALAIYDVMNWQPNPEGSIKVHTVGMVDEAAQADYVLTLDEDALFWNFDSHKVPRSVCSEICPPGTRRARRKGLPICCFDCLPCADGEISNVTDSTECTACPEEFWSSPEKDRCIPKEVEFLSYEEPLGISLTTASLFGSCFCAGVLGIFVRHQHTPVVSYFASCACLSDHTRYPTFLRTVPSNAFQAKAMARLLRMMGWSWVGIVYGDDAYGESGMQLLLKELEGSGVCVDYIEAIPKSYALSRIRRIVERIQSSKARVVVTFSISPDTEVLLREVVRQNVTDRQWIATTAWSTSSYYTTWSGITLAGTIGLALRSADIQGLSSYLNQLSPEKHPKEPLVQRVWEEVFGCKFGDENQSEPLKPQCTGLEKVEVLAESDVNYNVYKAVYAIAHAIQNMLDCQPGKGPFENGECPEIKPIQPKQLLHYLKAVEFTTPVGEQVNFDNNGDPSASYDIINWHIGSEGKMEFVKVGYFDAARGPEQDLQLDLKNIVWGGGWGDKVPVSVCSESCPPGTRKALQKGKPICCYDCIPCAKGEISNATDSSECTKCPERLWPNTDQTVCVPMLVEFLSFQDNMGIILSVLSVAGAALTGTVLAAFFRFRDTPLVRANNSELSFLLLLSLKLCFLCALAFIGRPAPWSCMLRHTLFGISFVVCLACVLSKTVVVLVAFRATLPGSNIMRYFNPVQQRAGIFFCTLVQVGICVLWVTLAPPLPTENAGGELGARVVLLCAVGSMAAFSLVLGYIGLLAAICFLLAFFARKLPDNFNEAKFITFSMLIFCAVWIAFVPAYVSSPGKYTVAVEIFAILASSYGLLVCIFAPKCYIILLRPERNTKKNMMAK